MKNCCTCVYFPLKHTVPPCDECFYTSERPNHLTRNEKSLPKLTMARFHAVYGNIPIVEIVNGLWETRKKSNLIKWLMMQADLSMDTLAAYFGCTKQYLNNKFNRDSFSFEDIIVAAYACDYTLTLLANNGSCERRIDAENFFDKDAKTWERISGLKTDTKESKRADYISRKAALEAITTAELGQEYEAIEAIPAANVVEVVRCRKCKYSDTFSDECEPTEFPLKCLSIRYGGVYPDWYCEHGVPKDGDGE